MTEQPARQLHLNANITDAGKHPSAWRHQRNPLAFLTPEYFVEIATIAERATFDAVFLSDWPALAENPPTKPWQALDPTVVLATVAAATSHIGLIGTASTTYGNPFELARRFASLDHLSKGRVAWNIVTTMHEQSARNFGLDRLPTHAERYAQADEFVDVVTKLWDSWPADGLRPDVEAGVFASAPIPAVDHVGPHFRVGGPLNVPRTPQGRPVLVQAGSSEHGKDLAARWADVVFTVQTVYEDAQAFYADIRSRAERFGRFADSVVVLPGLFPVVGSTEEEAKRRLAELNAQLDYGRELRRIAAQLGVDPDELRLDTPLDLQLVGALDAVPTSHGFLNTTVSFARQSGLTLRELIDRNGGAHRMVIGTPEQISDDIERWFTGRAADGFNLNFDVYPDGLQLFAEHVVPELRRRGIFRHEYTEPTLRGHLGLAPSNRPEGKGRPAAAQQAGSQRSDGRPTGSRSMAQGITGRITGTELIEALDGEQQLTILDLRTPAERAEGHIAVSAGLPYHDLEQRIAHLVPDPATRIVLVSDPEERGVALVERLGYTDVSVLDNGIDGWKAAGGRVYTGTNVRSKTLGEWIEHTYATPTVESATVAAWQAAGEKVVILDTRTPAEYLHHHIPGGYNTGGGAEVTYRAHQVIDDPATKVVVNCQGRTRGIVGAQSLINTPLQNPVYSLYNGTPAWEWAGQPIESGPGPAIPAPDEVGAELREWALETLNRSEATVLAPAEAQAHLDNATTTTYVLDVRSREEYLDGHFAAALAAPGGQLVQATDDYIAVRRSRVVLIDSGDFVRAANTAQWLHYLHDGPLHVVAYDATSQLVRADRVTVPLPADRRVTWDDVTAWRAAEPVRLVDVRESGRYRSAHVAGSVHGRREHLPELAADCGRVVLIGDADFAAEHLAADLPNAWVLDGGIDSVSEELVSDAGEYAGPVVDRTGPPSERGPERDAWYTEYFEWELALLRESEGDSFFDFDAVAAAVRT